MRKSRAEAPHAILPSPYFQWGLRQLSAIDTLRAIGLTKAVLVSQTTQHNSLWRHCINYGMENMEQTPTTTELLLRRKKRKHRKTKRQRQSLATLSILNVISGIGHKAGRINEHLTRQGAIS